MVEPASTDPDHAGSGSVVQGRDGGAGPWGFYPITNARAHEAVVEQITFAIRAGAFVPGERLPQIEALSNMMRVSKPVIGEALKVLSKAGVLKVQRGINGGLTVLTAEIPSRVMALTAPSIHVDVREIIEARRSVETTLAVLAGERATDSDFAMLEGCIERLRTHRGADLAQRIRYDHLFHYNIGRAAGSRTLALFQHQILEQLFLRMRRYFREIESIEAVIALHEDTLQALRTRDRATILAAIDRHLSPLEEIATARPDLGEPPPAPPSGLGDAETDDEAA